MTRSCNSQESTAKHGTDRSPLGNKGNLKSINLAKKRFSQRHQAGTIHRGTLEKLILWLYKSWPRRKAKAMNIEISTKEYRDLLDLLHIADVVMSGHRREPDTRSARHRALVQKLYSLARGEGLEQLISYNKSTQTYVSTVEFEKSSLAHVLIDEFGDHHFWDELISRLSARDAARITGGLQPLNAMGDNGRQVVEEPVRQRYIEEFAKNGVANLEVIERFGISGGIPAKTSD